MRNMRWYDTALVGILGTGPTHLTEPVSEGEKLVSGLGMA